jgi:hypothetical protein
MTQPQPLFVRCRVAKGFFDTEFLVIVAGSSAYVSRWNVRLEQDPVNGEVDGFVSAYLIEKAADRLLIELPGQAVVGGVRTWVPHSLVEAAPV